jgi:hypothetical protein
MTKKNSISKFLTKYVFYGVWVPLLLVGEGVRG